MTKGEKLKPLKVKILSSYEDEVYLWLFLMWVTVLNQYRLVVHH